jgi:cytochrome c2
MSQGMLVRFDEPLDPSIATNPSSYSIERWNYQRTANYGSPHFKLDGSKGQETLTVASAHLSRDGRSVFVGIAEMRPVMQMRLGWSLAMRDGTPFASSAYFSPRALPSFDPVAEGFEPFVLQLEHRPAVVRATTPPTPPSAAEGRRVAELMGCVACHSDDGSTIGKVGPTWQGLFGQRRSIVGGGEVVADEAYLRESIQDPPAKIPRGFEKGDIGMPSYEGVLTPAQIDALVLYLKSLR